jgi:hypothetical protein
VKGNISQEVNLREQGRKSLTIKYEHDRFKKRGNVVINIRKRRITEIALSLVYVFKEIKGRGMHDTNSTYPVVSQIVAQFIRFSG